MVALVTDVGVCEAVTEALRMSVGALSVNVHVSVIDMESLIDGVVLRTEEIVVVNDVEAIGDGLIDAVSVMSDDDETVIFGVFVRATADAAVTKSTETSSNVRSANNICGFCSRHPAFP